MSKVARAPEIPIRHRAPVITEEDREDQLIALAVARVEQRIRDGTASSQELTHYIKAGSTRERLEKEKLKQENELLRAKAESIRSDKDREESYKRAIAAMRSYQGSTDSEEEDPYE